VRQYANWRAGQAIRLIIARLGEKMPDLRLSGSRAIASRSTDAKSAAIFQTCPSAARKNCPRVEEADISPMKGIAESSRKRRAQIGDQDLLKTDALPRMG